MTGKMQALQIVLNNDRDPGCTEKLAMTRAWGERYRAEATAYMERRAYHFKRIAWLIEIAIERDILENYGGDENDDDWWIEEGPLTWPSASKTNNWENWAKHLAERYAYRKEREYIEYENWGEELYEEVELEFFEEYKDEPEWPEFENVLAEAEDQMLRDCATEPEW